MAEQKKPSTSVKPRNDGPKPMHVDLEHCESGVLHLKISGDYERFQAVCKNLSVAEGLINQAATIGCFGKALDTEATNFVLGFVDAMEPQDPAEALLLSQMAAVQQGIMLMAKRLNRTETVEQQDSAERALNKLTRTYAAQMETLKRYRAVAQQTVRVERVNVERGAQAIVGSVETGSGAHGKK